MKKIFIGLLVVITCFYGRSDARAETNFVIDSFQSNIAIQKDGSILVTETIMVDFTAESHGIYRDIPLVYQKPDGDKEYTEVILRSINNGVNRLAYEEINNNNYLRFKIGDPDKLVSGIQKYIITYSVMGVIKPFKTHDELYWNVTGNNWGVPIRAVMASVTIPSGEIIQTDCYLGVSGSKEVCDNINEKNRAVFTSHRGLNINEGLTLVAGFTKGIVPIINVSARLTIQEPIAIKYFIFGFLGIFILALLFLIRLWWRNGRDEYYLRKSLNDPEQKEIIKPLFGASEPIVPEYDSPHGLRPAEIGVLISEKVTSKEISATIVDLAIRGYIVISEKEKAGLFSKSDYQLTRTEQVVNNLLAYEEKLLDILFSDKKSLFLSELKVNQDISFKDLSSFSKSLSPDQTFHSSLPEVENLIYTSVTEKKIFTADPDSVRTKYQFLSFGLIIVFGLSIAGLSGGLNIDLGHSLLTWSILGGLCGAIINSLFLAFVYRFMPKRTAYGREIYRQALGYKLFVSGTEKYRQPFFEKENIFMEVLPYAMVFGVTSQLAKAMKEMQVEPMVGAWYIGDGIFQMDSFTKSITNFSSSLSSSIATTSGGSGIGGGGFSGGGFGGGGGGSW